jgi:hypothetical protein
MSKQENLDASFEEILRKADKDYAKKSEDFNSNNGSGNSGHAKSDTNEPTSATSPHDTLPRMFSKNMTPDDYINNALSQLGAVRRFISESDVGKLKAENVKKLSQLMIDYQYQDMKHLMTLGMDAQKKHRFVQYMEATKSLQQAIQVQSGAAIQAIIDGLIKNKIEAASSHNKQSTRLNQMVSEGKMTITQMEEIKRVNDEFTKRQNSELDKTAEIMMTRHIEHLLRTLELFRSTLIKEGLL